jgi:type IV pilus assembly protein PilA
MSELLWFYINDQQQRIGPCGALVLIDALQNGQVTLDTSIWREGMSDWQPLSMHANEIGVTPALERAAQRKQKNRGGSNRALSWLVILGGLTVMCVPILGILLAIAIPAYQDYSIRAKVMQVVNESSRFKSAASEYYIQHHACISDDKAKELGVTHSLAPSIQAVSFSELENGDCSIEIALADQLHPSLVEGKLLFEAAPGDVLKWRCLSTTILSKYLPKICRENF